jgi:hypothetical protein
MIQRFCEDSARPSSASKSFDTVCLRTATSALAALAVARASAAEKSEIPWTGEGS